jgi:cell division protein ZipA
VTHDEKPPTPRITVSLDGQDLFLAPSSESRARANAVLPAGPSEDAAAVLGAINVPVRPEDDSEDVDHLPSEALEWVVHVALQGDPELDPNKVPALFDVAWRKLHGGLTIYALDPSTKRWTFLISGNRPETVTRLQLAWSYVSDSEDEPAPTVVDFRRRLMGVRAAIAGLGTATVTSSAAPEEATERAARLRDIHGRLNQVVTLVLQAPKGKPFDGKAVWDVMLSLGLQWGDMDCFHWINEKGVGDDVFFSVSTTTAPGYFLPEEVVAGRVRVEDLVFEFSVPRTHDPVAVFDAMARAVEYSKTRLGGTAADVGGEPPDLEATRAEIRAISAELVAAGLPPGSDGTLLLF